VTLGGLVYHVLNRTVAGLPLFRKEADFEAFERIMIEAQQRHPTGIVAWCLMRNHWHFLLWPREEGEVTAFLRWLAHTHAMRWHVAHGTVGRGHLYQGRFKSFPIQEDGNDPLQAILSDWPMERPSHWVRLVNEPMTEK
jgi:putative transposase